MTATFAGRRGAARAFLGLVPWLAGCMEKPAPAVAEVRPVRTVLVAYRGMVDDRRAVGEIKARTETDLGFRLAGKLVERGAELGSVVVRGAVLARLEDQDYRNKLLAAEAEVAAARAVVTEAAGAEWRQRQLLATGTTTRSNYDGALKSFRSAEAKLVSAQASLGMAQDQLRYTDLLAEFDGVVTAIGAEPGQVVAAGQMVARLARAGERDAVFAIAEAAFGGALPAEVTVALLSNPAVRARGVVREIAPVADPATRTFQVKVGLEDPPAAMRLGASVVGQARVSGGRVAVLPAGALFDRGGAPAVWVVDPAALTVALTPVVVERFEPERVLIVGGLREGERVVVAGANRLREGQKVRLIEGTV